MAVVSRPGVRAVAVLVALALLGWHVHARSKPEADLNVGDRLLLSATGPVQAALTAVLSRTGGTWSHYVWLVGVSDENVQLRHELLQAQAAIAELAELRTENDRLRELAALRARVPGATVAAAVIGRGTSSRFLTIRIDRGSAAGVLPGQAVIAPGGAVGRVLRSSGRYADVLLLTDGLSAAGAVVQESRLRGVLLGDGGDELRMGFVRRNDAGGVGPGDLLVTTGEDDLFPEGIALGRVVDASVPETGLFLEVAVEAAVDTDQLDEVLVVLDRGTGPWSSGSITAPMEEVAPDDGAAQGAP